MSSPFAAFRKNQKMMMVILGVLVMVAFLILPPLLEYDWNASVDDVEVVRTRYGVLNESDIQKLAQRRSLANQFIYNAMASAGFQPVENFFGPVGDSYLVTTMLLHQKAKELGIEVPDSQVIAEFERFTDKRVGGNEISDIAKGLRVQESEIMEALRYELIAQQYQALQYTGVQIGTPLDRWNQYESVNREVAVEVIPLPVDNYVVKVKEPTEAQLREFFDLYQDNLAAVKSGEPGFKQPEKAAFQYFRAKLSDFVTQVAVTDEEIAAYYEQNKHEFPYAAFSQSFQNPFVTPEPPASDLPPEENAPPAETPVTPATEGEATSTETPPAETASETTTPEATTPEAATPEAAPPTEEAAPTPPVEAAPETGEPQSSVRRSPFRLAAYRMQAEVPKEEAAEEADAALPVDETVAPATDATSPPDDALLPGTETPPDTQPPLATETPADPTTGDAVPAVPEPADEPLVPAEMMLPEAVDGGPDPEFAPLWMVQEQIRQRIAQEKALPMMTKVIGDLSREMRKYESKHKGWLALKQQKPDAPKPEPIDFNDLARKFGVETKQTPLMAADAIFYSDEFTIGKSFVGQGTTQNNMFAQMAYGSLPLFQVRESHDLRGDQYVFWKTEEKDAFLPTFEEVRGEVLDAWKREEARKLVVAEADKLAAQAREAKKSLREVFADRADLPVTTPSPFTWKYQTRSERRPFEVSTVVGVPDAGEEFMKATYNLGVGEVGVAFDATKSTAYLIRLENTTPDPNILHTLFLMTPYASYGSAGFDASQQRQNNWMQELNAQAEVQWIRAPREI
jgi:hypothetical protein